MAKKTPASKKRQPTSPKKAKAKKPLKSTKKKAASKRTTASKATKQSKAAPAARSAKSAKRKSPKRTGATAAKNARRAGAKTAKRAGVPIRKTVDGYVATLNDWRKDCVAGLRTMIRKAAPAASEKVKWSQPVYEHHGPFAWIKAHAKHVNLGFWRGVELPDPRKLLKGTGKKMRHIKLKNIKDAGKKELQELVRLAAKLNELKGNPTRRSKKAKSK